MTFSVYIPDSLPGSVRTGSDPHLHRILLSFYIEPESLSPTWVHFDRRFGTAACTSGGFPLIKQNSRGNYVCVAQDDLNTLGYTTGGLDGVFGGQTQNAVRRYQASRELSVDGIIGCNTWKSLQENVVGTGATSTTIN